MLPTLLQIIETVSVGLFAGLLGGLAGIGGSMIILPALHFVYGEPADSVHHRYMAAAMIVNLAVAIPAARRHRLLGAVRTDLLVILTTSTCIGVVAGVLTSNMLAGRALKVGLAAFIVAYSIYNIARIITGPRLLDAPAQAVSPWKLVLAGMSTGLVAGLLGLGGGVVMVPLLQTLCGIRLRQAIGTSSAAMVATSLIGASLKVWTLRDHGEPLGGPEGAITLAALMIPGAIIGATWGASLNHRLPIRLVRAVITVLLLGSAWRLAGSDALRVLGWNAFRTTGQTPTGTDAP